MNVAGNFDNVFIEIMNEARKTNTSLEDFRKWHEEVTKWIREPVPDIEGYPDANTYPDTSEMLVSANVLELEGSLSDFSCKLYMAKDSSVAADIISAHQKQWVNPDNEDIIIQGTLDELLGKFHKPVIIDDDGASRQRTSQKAVDWAKDVRNYVNANNNADLGKAHYNSKGPIKQGTLDCERLTGDGLQDDIGFEDLPKKPLTSGTSGECTASGAGSGGELPDKPLPPTLIAPLNGKWADQTPTLDWSASTGATSYHYQVRRFSGGSPVYLENDTTATQLAIGSGNLDLNYYYKWRVFACNAAGCSEWSTEWSFRPRLFGRIDMGNPDAADGVTRIEGSDGETVTETITTHPSNCAAGERNKPVMLRKNRGENGGGANDRYVYFDVLNDFIEDGEDGEDQDQTAFDIEVRYWDHLAPGWQPQMCVYYDSDHGAALAGCVNVGNSECMKAVTFEVNDARFNDGLASNADIRIKSGTDDPPATRRYINIVTVTRQ